EFDWVIGQLSNRVIGALILNYSITKFPNYSISPSQYPSRGSTNGYPSSGRSLRSPHATQGARIHYCRGPDSCPWHWRKQRNLYGYRLSSAASAAIQRCRPPRLPERREQAAQGHVSRLPQFSGLAEPESCL